MIFWLGFLICTSVIVYSGTRLSKYGDIIAEKTGLGRTWIGVVLMASAQKKSPSSWHGILSELSQCILLI